MSSQPPLSPGSPRLVRTVSVMTRNAVGTAIDDAVVYRVGLLLAIIVVVRRIAAAERRLMPPTDRRAKDLR